MAMAFAVDIEKNRNYLPSCMFLRALETPPTHTHTPVKLCPKFEGKVLRRFYYKQTHVGVGGILFWFLVVI